MSSDRIPSESHTSQSSSSPNQEESLEQKADSLASKVLTTPSPPRYVSSLGQGRSVRVLTFEKSGRLIPSFDLEGDEESFGVDSDEESFEGEASEEVERVSRPAKKSNVAPFSCELPTVTDSKFEGVQGPKELNVRLTTVYQCPDRAPLHVVKQPPQKNSCGAGAVLMMLLSYWQEFDDPAASASEHLIDQFWTWYSRCELSDKDYLQDKVDKLVGLKLATGVFSGETSHIDALRSIKSILDRTRLPIICSITHPQLEGHWIVIDQVSFEEERVWLRDPFSGKAYMISFDEFQTKCWSERVGESYIFFE